MAFARQNVLDVINKGHYHSCVMTCYSFDFQFFELKVMRALRAAGVKNILVLVDGRFLEKLASRSTGMEFLLSSGFSIYPIYIPGGVFHPKIMLLFGKKDGMLTLGSGNLTASGLGNNDEAWGCFQVEDYGTSNAALFAEAWHYVQTLTVGLKGVAAEKVGWIKEFTPWLGQLPAAGQEPSWETSGNVVFLNNKKNKGILQQALALVGDDAVEKITCISPYYDKTGLVLQHLKQQYPKAKLQCVVEGRMGILPTGMKAAQAEGIAFYPWQECGARKDGLTSSRLHAKLIHFTTKQGEYLLMGSANVTASGMGAGSRKPQNEEASLLLFRQKGNYLQEMGIKVPSTGAISYAKLPSYLVQAGQLPLEGEEEVGLESSVRLILAELEPSALTLHLMNAFEGKFTVCLLDSDQIEVFTSEPTPLTAVMRLSLPEIEDYVSLVEIRNASGAVVGRQFVQFPAEQYKYCPDPRLEKLQKALSDLTLMGMDGFAELLDLVEMEDVGVTSNSTTERGTKGSLALGKQGAEKLSAQEFTTLAEAQLAKQRAVLNTPNVRIVDFLNLLGKNLVTTVTDEAYAPSAEQGIDVDTGAGDDVTTTEEVRGYAEQTLNFEREVKCLNRFLGRLYKNQVGRLKELTNANAHFKLELPKITLRDLATFNVALHVAINYVGKYFTYQEDAQEWNEFYLYRTNEEDLRSYNCLKGICNLTIGQFLLLSTGGFQHHEDPVVQKRMDGYRQTAFEMVTFLVVHTPWKESERDVRDLLLCNAMHYLRPSSWSLQELNTLLAPSINTLKGRAPFAYENGQERLKEQLGRVMPKLQQLRKAAQYNGVSLPIKQAKAFLGGEWVFLKRLGICQFKRKYAQAKELTISLNRPGFPDLEDDLRGTYQYTVAPENGVLVINN